MAEKQGSAAQDINYGTEWKVWFKVEIHMPWKISKYNEKEEKKDLQKSINNSQQLPKNEKNSGFLFFSGMEIISSTNRYRMEHKTRKTDSIYH